MGRATFGKTRHTDLATQCLAADLLLQPVPYILLLLSARKEFSLGLQPNSPRFYWGDRNWADRICFSRVRGDPAVACAAPSAGAKATAQPQFHECCPTESPGGWSIQRTGHCCQGEGVASRIGSGGLRAHGDTAPGARPRRSQGQLPRRQRDPLQGRRQRVPRPAGCGCGWARVPGESGSSR